MDNKALARTEPVPELPKNTALEETAEFTRPELQPLEETGEFTRPDVHAQIQKKEYTSEKEEQAEKIPDMQVDGRDFKIVEKLGKGAMGYVYLGHEIKKTKDGEEFFGRDVVIKVLKPSFLKEKEVVERFQQEILSQTKVSGVEPYVVATVDVVDVSIGERGEKTVGLLLEHMRDGDLANFVEDIHKENSELSEKEKEALITNVGVQLCRAVGGMHESGYVHRDIKPQNIFINKEGAGHLKLGDFGLVEALENTKGEPHNGEREIYGTISYMPPEGVEGKKPDKGFDLYAIGGVLYNMRTGHRPLRAEFGNIVVGAISRLREDVPPIKEHLQDAYTPSFLDDIIMTLVERDPEKRKKVVIDGKEYSLESAQDILDTITECAEKRGVPTQMPWPEVK
jgi:serine/threonine-protein kinase